MSGFNPRDKTMITDYRYPHPHTKEPMPGGKFPATGFFQRTNSNKLEMFVFKINDGVYKPDDKVLNAKKEIEVSIYDRAAIFRMVEDACTNPLFTKAQWPIKRKGRFMGGQFTDQDKLFTLATFTVIRDPDGIISLGYAKSDYKALLEFTLPTDNEAMFFEDGQWVHKRGYMSQIFASSWANWTRDEMIRQEVAAYRPPESKKGNGGGGGGHSGGHGGGGNSGYSRPPADFDDDIPF